MSLARVQFFSISLDGFGTGEGLKLLPRNRSATLANGCTSGCSPPGGGATGSVSRAAAAAWMTPSCGCTIRSCAEIMGSRKFGPPGWHEDPGWKGWWGPDPPFHTPVFVLTHHSRPSIEMEGGTTFHFIDASPAETLETARQAAGGQDVRIGGGVTTIREFVAARLVDHDDRGVYRVFGHDVRRRRVDAAARGPGLPPAHRACACSPTGSTSRADASRGRRRDRGATDLDYIFERRPDPSLAGGSTDALSAEGAVHGLDRAALTT